MPADIVVSIMQNVKKEKFVISKLNFHIIAVSLLLRLPIKKKRGGEKENHIACY